MKNLILFDIDKTLVDASKSHFIAFSRAVMETYGVRASSNMIDYHGMTDKQILIEVLRKTGIEEKIILARLEACCSLMSAIYSEIVIREEVVVLAGVKDLLEALDKAGELLGLVTGNLEDIAYAKLEKGGLRGYFKVGGFGSEDTERSNLIKYAIEKAEKNFNFIRNNNVFVMGDTPRDIAAGKKMRVKTIGIATGSFNIKELEGAGSDFVFENLKDTKKIMEILTSG